jgi:hypothetical protein
MSDVFVDLLLIKTKLNWVMTGKGAGWSIPMFHFLKITSAISN